MKSHPETPFVIRTRHAHLAAVLHRAPGDRLVILCHGFTGDKTAFNRLLVQGARRLHEEPPALAFGPGEAVAEDDQPLAGRAMMHRREMGVRRANAEGRFWERSAH